jgi:uncharacterized surface protein with fasciclin (FAS1) repeats
MKFASIILCSLAIAACGGETQEAKSPANASDTTTAAPLGAQADIIDTAVGAGKFKTLATALTKAGLIETLKGPGPFTVFAPTDEAFAALPPGALDKVLADGALLKSVLTYHVVSGKVMASEVTKMTSAKTVQGTDVAIKMSGSNVMINDAKVVTADIVCKNGVIHVIDKVIMPK